MTRILTQEAISSVRDRVVKWQRPSKSILRAHLPEGYSSWRYHTMWNDTYRLYYHIKPSLWSFRKKLEHFLDQILSLSEGTTQEYILYEMRRVSKGVKVRALPKRIKSIRTLHSVEMLYDRSIPTPKATELCPERKLATAILDITFLRCLFSLGSSKWDSGDEVYSNDLSKAALPDDDVLVRIGRYNLIYDSCAKEWFIWKKNPTTKIVV